MTNNETKCSPNIIFQKEIEEIQATIANFELGQKTNIAIIGESFSGKTILANEIYNINTHKVLKNSFSSIVKDTNEILISDDSKRIVIIDDCQFIYMRKIGGFNILENFLKSIALSNKLYITVWNIYTWNYLNEVFNIEQFFPVQIKIHKFTADEIKECILSKYETDEINFIEDVEFEKEKLIELAKYPLNIKFIDKSINIPFFKINHSILKMKFSKKEKKPLTQDIIFEKIRHISDGNIGISKVIWERSLEYPIMKPSKVKEISYNISLDYKYAFILEIILSMKLIKKDELKNIGEYEYNIDEIIYSLQRQQLVNYENGYCGIKPEALNSIVFFLKKYRLVW